MTIVLFLSTYHLFIYLCFYFLPVLCKPLNVEFQRIARRDKKAFLSDQYKEIEENNRMD